jgi:hypothetical protein
MDAHYNVELPQAFVCGEDELKKLIQLFTGRIGVLEIRTDCADDVSRTFKTLSELIAFENPRGKEIRRLHISARSDDFTRRASIDLSGSRWYGISLDFLARDDVVTRLRTEILDIIGGMRPWYTLLHRVDFVYILFVIYFLLWFSLLLAAAFNWIPVETSKESSVNSSASAQLIIIGIIAIFFALGTVLNRFRDTIFPRAVFLIGQGKNRFQQLERFQWGVIIAFIVSFAAGIIIAIWQAIAA